jgi:poly(3-hydroxybutyrate) depolymerase
MNRITHAVGFLVLLCALVPASCSQSSATAPGPPNQSDAGEADAAAADAAMDDAAADAATMDSGTCTPPAAPEGGSDCAAPLTPGTDRKCTLNVGGQARELLLYAPATFDPCKPAALVVDAHGSSETDAEQAGLQPFMDWPSGLGSGWRLVADREGFLVAQPQGIGNQWTQPDTDFMLQIPAVVAQAANVDPKRVFMTGISNGGELTYWTGCRDTAVFRGFAPVSGFGQEACPLTHPAPLIAFHSADDMLVPLADGQAAFQMWVASNHCKAGPVASWQFGGPSTDPREVCLSSGAGQTPPWKLAACDPSAPATTCQTWSQCDGGVEASFCVVPADQQHHFAQTGGHVLYINGTNLSLAAVAWEFFK